MQRPVLPKETLTGQWVQSHLVCWKQPGQSFYFDPIESEFTTLICEVKTSLSLSLWDQSSDRRTVLRHSCSSHMLTGGLMRALFWLAKSKPCVCFHLDLIRMKQCAAGAAASIWTATRCSFENRVWIEESCPSLHLIVRVGIKRLLFYCGSSWGFILTGGVNQLLFCVSKEIMIISIWSHSGSILANTGNLAASRACMGKWEESKLALGQLLVQHVILQASCFHRPLCCN